MLNLLPDFAYEHIDGDPVAVPGWALVAAHDFDEVELPVPGKPKIKLPCAHIRLQQTSTPQNVGTVPCRHLMPELARDSSRDVIYHASGAALQQAVAHAVDRLTALGVRRMGTPLRPLRIFNRPLAPSPHAQDGTNPLWSKYHPILHAINVHHDLAAARQQFLDTLHHELGHATLGHSCVQVTSPGGPHDLDASSHPALALSEGWAHFVALAIRFQPEQSRPDNYKENNWEQRKAGVPRRANIESNVARALWDLYDLPNDTRPPPPGMAVVAADAVTLPFAKLFEVFSPSLATLRDGPTIDSANEYFDRLCALNPAQTDAIRRVQLMHLG